MYFGLKKKAFIYIFRLAGAVVLSVFLLAGISAALLYIAFGITSSNAVLYAVRDEAGGVSFSTDLDFEDSDRLIFMLDASCLFSLFERVASAALNTPLIELTWNREQGKGAIKEIRPDGTKFLVVLSRYREGDRPYGVFIGGDLPYGDFDRWLDESRNNTGMAYYDGNRWRHVWCSINEAVSIEGIGEQIMPWDWQYLGSRVLKRTLTEVIVESSHRASRMDRFGNIINIAMDRTITKRAGEDFARIRVTFRNDGNLPVVLNFAFGDEPWIGEFGDSSGDVGWAGENLVEQQGFIPTRRVHMAGFADIGNRILHEYGRFTGTVNFIDWSTNPPSVAYFSNVFGRVDEGRPLDSMDNRIINLLWLDQRLVPGQSRSYTLTLGMVGQPGTE